MKNFITFCLSLMLFVVCTFAHGVVSKSALTKTEMSLVNGLLPNLEPDLNRFSFSLPVIAFSSGYKYQHVNTESHQMKKFKPVGDYAKYIRDLRKEARFLKNLKC